MSYIISQNVVNSEPQNRLYREAILDLQAFRIAQISALGMRDPAVIPLWYGEGDLP
jgi:hypothetical protein